VAVVGRTPGHAGAPFSLACTLPDGPVARLALYDVAGRCVGSRQIASSGTVTFTGGLRTGVYWAQLAQCGRAVTRRFVVAP
jgi:hypothetical protein